MRRVLILQLTAKFGPAADRVVAWVRATTDPDELNRLGVRLLKTTAAEELPGG